MEGVARFKALTASLVDAHFQAMGERGADKEPLVSIKTVAGYSVVQKILGL